MWKGLRDVGSDGLWQQQLVLPHGVHIHPVVFKVASGSVVPGQRLTSVETTVFLDRSRERK